MRENNKCNLIFLMKEMCYDILKNEVSNKDIVHIFPITFIEFLGNCSILKKFNLTKISAYKTLKNNFGIYNNGNICIFLNHFKRFSFVHKKCWQYDIAFSCYHELAHFYQTSTPFNGSYEQFVFLIEDIISRNTSYYKTNHDSFFVELTADLYAIEKTKKYLDKNNIVYNDYYIDSRREKILKKYNNYDFQNFFTIFNELLKNNNDKILFDNIFLNKYINFLYKYNNTFKSPSEILNNKDTNLFNQKFLTEILTSKCYLENINIDSFDVNDLSIIVTLLKTKINDLQKESESFIKLENLSYLNSILNKLTRIPLSKK